MYQVLVISEYNFILKTGKLISFQNFTHLVVTKKRKKSLFYDLKFRIRNPKHSIYLSIHNS